MKQITSITQEALLLLSEPNLINSIESLHSISNLYQSIIQFIKSNQNHIITKSNQSLALTSLASALSRELIEYQTLLTDLEFKLLSHHPTLPQLSKILNRIQISIEHLWVDALRSFVIYGQRPQETNSIHHDIQLIDDLFLAQRVSPPGITTDQIKHQPLVYLLKPNALPHLPSLNPHSRILHSIDQICLALSILSHLHQLKSNRSRSNRLSPLKLILPTQLQSQLAHTLSKVDHLSHPAFRHTIEAVQGSSLILKINFK
ncbi:hypothetical protein DFH28DRAFT_980884, partial [Melampsora americana]